MSPVLAADSWPTNAALIRAVARLGYLRDHDTILDPTFGGGGWWKAWRPTAAMTCFNRERDGSDFRKLPLASECVDAVAYDPPYVCPGGRATSTIKAMHARYGMDEQQAEPEGAMFTTPAELQQMIDDGLTEMWRLVRPSAGRGMHPTQRNGVVLVKCKDYIWGGRLWAGTHRTLSHAESLGFDLWDRLEHLSGTGPQPATNRDGSPRPQRHARRNLSTLLVLRRPKP